MDLHEFNKQISAYKWIAFKHNLIFFLERKVAEAVIGLFAAILLKYLAVDFIPGILTTNLEIASGAAKFSILFDKEVLKNIFTVKNCFVVLFGIRFIIDYIVNGFSKIVTSKSN